MFAVRDLDQAVIVAKGIVRIKMKGRLDIASEHKRSKMGASDETP